MVEDYLFTAVLAAAGAFDSTAVAEFFLAIAVLLGGARLLGELARYLGQPPIVGEISAGILLGKTVLGRLSPDSFDHLFGAGLGTAASTGLQAVLTLSAALLLLVAGLEVDLKAVKRERKATICVGFLSMLLPFTTGFGLAYLMPSAFGQGNHEQPLVFALFIGVALSITALPVIAKILMDLGLQHSNLGVVILASAVANDLVGWIGFASVLALAGTGTGNSVFFTISMTIAFAALCLTIGRKLAGPALTWIQANGGWPTGVLSTVFVVAFFAAAFTEWIGVHAIFGAFLAGVLFADTGKLRERTQQSIEDIVGAVFAPLFFAFIALKVDFFHDFDWKITVVVISIAVIGKLIGGWLGAKLAKMGRRESWAVGAGMTARGAMEIILAELAVEAGIIDSELFVAIIIMALITSILAGPAIEHILARAGQFNLSQILHRDHIVTNLHSATAEDAIAELAIAAHMPAEAAEVILNRERQLPTGLPGGWALPHGRHRGLKHPIVAIGIAPSGIDYTAPDGSLTCIIILLLTPSEHADMQPIWLAAIARVFGNAKLREEILADASPTEIKAAIHVLESSKHED